MIRTRGDSFGGLVIDVVTAGACDSSVGSFFVSFSFSPVGTNVAVAGGEIGLPVAVCRVNHPENRGRCILMG